jgi:hypothetical protein
MRQNPIGALKQRRFQKQQRQSLLAMTLEIDQKVLDARR